MKPCTAAALTPPQGGGNMFAQSLETLTKDMSINYYSPFFAAQQAVIGFEQLPGDAKKTFILTGNEQNVNILPYPMMVTLGAGKSASAYWIGSASVNFKDKGYR
jgi:hypothetical protein